MASHYNSSLSGGHVAGDNIHGMNDNNENGRTQTPKIEEANDDGELIPIIRFSGKNRTY